MVKQQDWPTRELAWLADQQKKYGNRKDEFRAKMTSSQRTQFDLAKRYHEQKIDMINKRRAYVGKIIKDNHAKKLALFLTKFAEVQIDVSRKGKTTSKEKMVAQYLAKYYYKFRILYMARKVNYWNADFTRDTLKTLIGQYPGRLLSLIGQKSEQL